MDLSQLSCFQKDELEASQTYDHSELTHSAIQIKDDTLLKKDIDINKHKA